MSEQRREPTVERIAWDGRVTTVTWLAPPFRPTRRLTTQALGLCFTAEGQIVLLTYDGVNWTLPGDASAEGETLEVALARELRQEARVRIVASDYIGCQRVEDPQRKDGPALYYQARFWARVELDPFESPDGACERRLVWPDEFLETLAWGHTATARIILAEGLRLEMLVAEGVTPQG